MRQLFGKWQLLGRYVHDSTDDAPRRGIHVWEPEEATHFLWHKLMELGLSDKQIDAIKTIRIWVEKDTIKKRAELELARVDLRELLCKDQVDMNASEASLKKVESLRTDLKFNHIKVIEEIKATLTLEQRRKLKEDIRVSFMTDERKCGETHSKYESTPPV